MAVTCPDCGCHFTPATARSGADVFEDEAVVAVEVALRAACASIGATVTGTGQVDEATAARLLAGDKLSPLTMGNWRGQHRPIPFSKIGRSTFYSLRDLALFMRKTRRSAE